MSQVSTQIDMFKKNSKNICPWDMYTCTFLKKVGSYDMCMYVLIGVKIINFLKMNTISKYLYQSP